MNRFKHTIISLAFLLILLQQFCTNEISGGAVEDGNAEAVSGIITTSLGDTVPYAKVNIIPSNFNPAIEVLPDSLSITTDENGHFLFNLLPTGNYRIFCSDSSNEINGISSSIEITESTTKIVTPSLRAPGVINIDSSSIVMDYPNGVVYLEGTLIYQAINSQGQGFISFEMVPEGTYKVLLYSEQDDTSFVIFDSIAVTSGATTNR